MKTVISCSRRSDVPAFYSDWLVAALETGSVWVANPFNGRRRRVNLTPNSVHTLVLWSKNFAPLLGRADAFRRYHLFFHFTINTPCELEGALPPLDARLEQMAEISRRFGSQRLTWRFDPIVFWRTKDGSLRHNLGAFERIASFAAKCGVKRCVISFVTLYRKVLLRQRRLGVWFEELSSERKREIAAELADKAARFGIKVFACCQPVLAEVVAPSACISGELLSELAGEPAPTKKDPGQRKECNCTVSVDIGRYRSCRYRCAYCYAI